jgi:Pyridoxal-phosphate dependent enzyme
LFDAKTRVPPRELKSETRKMSASARSEPMPFQYGNDANPRAHYEGTGAEIGEALDRVDVLVAGLGTRDTLMGTGERLREVFPDVVVAAAEPLPGDPVMGLRSLADAYVPPILDVTKLDRKVLVSNAESAPGLHALLDREGVFGSVSAGAVIHVARKLAQELDEGVIVCVLADARWKYLSADFWTRATSTSRWRRPFGGSPGGRPGARSSSTRWPSSRNQACGLVTRRFSDRASHTPASRLLASNWRSSPPDVLTGTCLQGRHSTTRRGRMGTHLQEAVHLTVCADTH